MLPRGGTLARRRVTERKRDHEGNVIGRSNTNTILDTQEYEVKFEDGDFTELTLNVIAESIYAICDENGQLLHQIVGYGHRFHCTWRTLIQQLHLRSVQ